MINFRLRKVVPPFFEADTSEVYNVFRRFHIFRQAHRPVWSNDVAVNMLKILLDDNSLDFVESLPFDTQQNYELLRDCLLDHYEKNSPLSVQCSTCSTGKRISYRILRSLP